MRPDRLLALICITLAGCGVTRPPREPQSGPAELKFRLATTRGTVDDLVLDRFLFNGVSVEPKTLQVQTLAPGVHEVTADRAVTFTREAIEFDHTGTTAVSWR
jgi:hypothetical protein